MRSPKNILRHELIGLKCKVIKADNKSQVGLEGKIIDETMKTLVVKDNNKKTVMKKGTVFRIRVGKNTVDVDGSYLVSRPEDRIKKKFKKW